MGQSRINCSSEVYSDPATWRLSRDFLEQQIRILRVQLNELKVIRKHLRAVRPTGGEKFAGPNKHRPNSKSKLTTSSTLFDWSLPPLANRTVTNVSDSVYQPPSPTSSLSGSNRRKQPKAPETAMDSDGQEDEDEIEEDGEEENPTADPVESIEVTIYDNRKIK